jgi:hypothetical protein
MIPHLFLPTQPLLPALILVVAFCIGVPIALGISLMHRRNRPSDDLFLGTCEVEACMEPEASRITIPGRFISLCPHHLSTYNEALRDRERGAWMRTHLPRD